MPCYVWMPLEMRIGCCVTVPFLAYLGSVTNVLGALELRAGEGNRRLEVRSLNFQRERNYPGKVPPFP